MRLKISARKSDLARIQAYLVGEALKEKNPEIEIEYLFRESLGDINLTDPLWKMPERGVFTEDFYQDLLSEKTDMVVHSWKDLPVEAKPDTLIAASMPRADQRDVLLFKKTSVQKAPAQVKIFSSSPRRAHNLKSFLLKALPFKVEEVKFLTVRGHVQTRVRKLLDEEQVDGLIVAKAAIDRMLTTSREEFLQSKVFLSQALKKFNWMILPLSENPNAAAQGALAIEISAHRQDLKKILSTINCEKTFQCVEKERQILAAHGGGCHQKIGVSVLRRSYGQLEITKGETLEGQKLDETNLLMSKLVPRSELNPYLDSTSAPMERKKIPYFIPAHVNGLYVAREEAVDNEMFVANRTVWAAGWSTWQKLSAKAVWVNGCSEGMGEEELPELSHWVDSPITWCRLTHNKAAKDLNMLTIPTYEIIASDLKMNIDNKNIFFWRSALQFAQAIERYPELKDLYHACGPGRTYKIICETLGQSKKVFIFLNEEHWRQSWQ